MGRLSRLFPSFLVAFFLITVSLASASPVGGAAPPKTPLALARTTASSLSVANADVSVLSMGAGLVGSITADILTADLTGGGADEVLLGTSKGLYALSHGDAIQHIVTSSSVLDMAPLDDITGDGRPDVALAVGDTEFPNFRAYDGATGKKVWDFVPKQAVFINNQMWTEQQTLTFDLEAVDLNSDDAKDVIATSGYYVYALDGKSGAQLWRFETSDNLWRIAVTPDLTGDGVPDMAVGGQNGYLYVLDGKDGGLLWKKRLVGRYRVVPGEGGGGAYTVDRSVWDIVPVNILGTPKVVVSSEDGRIRLVDLAEGDVNWDFQVVEYVEVLLARYYAPKFKRATSPGDFYFFNLGVAPALDGDGVMEIAYQRHREDQPSQGVFLSPAPGQELISVDSYDPRNVTMDLASADLDGDKEADTIVFQRWVEGRDGPLLRVVSGQAGSVVWEFTTTKSRTCLTGGTTRGPSCPRPPLRM